MMHIGIDGTALYGRYGGVEYSLWNLLSALQVIDQDNRYTVYIPRDGPPPARLRAFGSRWQWLRLPFRGGNRARRVFWQQAQWPAQLQQDRCDLVHAPTYISPLLSPVPVVLTAYDLIALTHPQYATRLNQVHYGSLLVRCLARARSVIVPSDAVRAEVTARVPGALAKTFVIPLGVEPVFLRDYDEAARRKVRARYSLPERYLLFVGNFEPKKNLRNVLRALDYMPEAPPLVMVGGARAWTGYEAKDLLHDAGTTPGAPATARACAVGYVQRCDLPLLYAMSEAFVFPSLAEGFGLPVLEALASGTAVVASNAVQLPHLNQVALICDPLEPQSIAASVRQLHDDPALRDNLRQRGRAYARAFTWRRTAEMTLEVYRQAGSG